MPGKRGRPRKLPPAADEPPSLTPAQWKGARLEASEHPKQFTAAQVAQKADVSPQAVAKWKNNPHYLKAIQQLIDKRCCDELQKRLDKRPANKARRSWRTVRLENLHVDAKNNWQGPTKCPLCGAVFDDPTTYVLHIEQHGPHGYLVPDDNN
jgi:uncharacterized C2H2 Zn-finger protein